jgi:antitoxin component of MazEF toxin-antitoxin module
MNNKRNKICDSETFSEDDLALLEVDSSTNSKHKRSLEELLEGVSPDTIHREVDWGSPVGKEVF